MNIWVISNVLYSNQLAAKTRDEYQAAARKDVELVFKNVRNGTQTIESEFDLALAQPGTMELVRDAQQEGADACIVTCFGDPGTYGAREIAAIPVVGAGEAALHLAHLLGYRYTIITVRAQTIPLMRNLAVRVGLAERLASIRAVEFGVLDFGTECIPRVVELSAQAVQQDGAEVIVMGCTGTCAGMAARAEQALRDRTGVYVPVVDPAQAAMKLAESLVDLRITHSKLAYPSPPSGRPEYRFLPGMPISSAGS
jgi:allantoin racemase